MVGMRSRFLTIFGTMILSSLTLPMRAQVTDQAARLQARNAVRSQLHLKPDKFLIIQRDERLETLAAIVVGRPTAQTSSTKSTRQEMRSRKTLSSTTS